MALLKLYGLRGSDCTRRVLVTLEELGLPYEFETIGMGQMKSAEYIANRQPFGKVPSFEDGNFKIFESRAIVCYIASAYDQKGTLYPADAKTRGIIEQWISVEQSYYNAAEVLVDQLIFAKMRGASVDEARVKSAEKGLEQVLSVLDSHLAKSKYLAGNNFTIADIVYLPYTSRILNSLPQYLDLYQKHANIMRWWSEISNRESWKKASSFSEF